ncbi:MAG: gliding motility-associated C-terminal domain-containing protein, partial [Bacteroidia bacterium]|nr:gliding motility-associated C-terminal domain-containing protein [Bacteroidia bacterium]
AYSWGPSGGTNSTAGGLPAGIYTITVTDGQACTATTIATVTEPPDITIVLTASKISCFGNSGGTITAVVGGGTPGYSYSWSSGGTTLTETNLIAGQYYFSVTDLNACVKSDTVDVLQPPVLDATISVVNNVSCLGGSNGKIKVSVTGGTPIYTYSWTPVSGTDSILASLTPDTYSVTIIDSSGCSVTRSAVITEPAPFAAVVTKKNISCFGSKDGQAKIVVTGGSLPYIYSWSPITNFTDSASGIDAISFTITVIDSLGCIYTHSDSLTQPPPLTLQTVSTAAHCSKNDGSLIAAVTGGTPPYNYLWNPSGNTNSSADSLVSGNYSLTVTDLNGCTITQGDSIANIPGPILSITSVTNSTCANTCVGTATSQLSGGTGPYSYSWSTVPAQFDSVAVNMCVGNYFIQITDSAGCVDTANVTIGSPTINIVLTALDTDICIGQISHLTATATGGTPSYTYNWNNGAYTGQNYDVTPGVTTTYTVIATDSTGCPSDSATVTVKVKPPIDVIASGTPAASCHGTPTKLSVTATGGDGNYSYTWQPGGFVGTDTTVVPDVTTTYTIIGNDGCGTQPDTTLITVKVHPRPVAQFVSNDTSGCMFTCTGFNDQSTIIAGDTITSWHWNFGDGQTSNLKDPTNCYRAVGQYKVSLSVRTSNGCVDTIVKNGFITIHGLPKAEFTIKPDSVSVLEPLVNFTDAATDAVSWKWDFGDGSTVDSLNYVQNPRHTYKDTGRYCVWQFVTNMYGCVDSIKHCLKVYPEFTFYIPNAFSPNGDIFNETFNGKGTFIKEYEMIIFDRWGNLIYTTNNLNIGWDGRANEGKDVAQQDVYVWKVNIIDIFDREHHYIGHVTLVK